MSTSAEVEAAWQTEIWSHDSLTALTDKFHTFQVTLDSEFELSKLQYRGKVNFFEILTGRSQRWLQTASNLGRIVEYDYAVEINYYKAVDTSGDAHNVVRDAFETIFPLVVSELGDTWSSTVDLWRPDTAIPTIVSAEIREQKVWKGTYRYFAEKQSQL